MSSAPISVIDTADSTAWVSGVVPASIGASSASTPGTAGPAAAATIRGTQTRRTLRTLTFSLWPTHASRPWASSSATTMMSAMPAVVERPSASADLNSGSVSTARATSAATASLGRTLPSRTRFSMFSTFQLNSPIATAPTRRPLPLRVWKDRRIDFNDSWSERLPAHTGTNSDSCRISSPTSSRKISRISESISLETAIWNAAGIAGCTSSSTSSSTSTHSPSSVDAPVSAKVSVASADATTGAGRSSDAAP